MSAVTDWLTGRSASLLAPSQRSTHAYGFVRSTSKREFSCMLSSGGYDRSLHHARELLIFFSSSSPVIFLHQWWWVASEGLLSPFVLFDRWRLIKYLLLSFSLARSLALSPFTFIHRSIYLSLIVSVCKLDTCSRMKRERQAYICFSTTRTRTTSTTTNVFFSSCIHVTLSFAGSRRRRRCRSRQNGHVRSRQRRLFSLFLRRHRRRPRRWFSFSDATRTPAMFSLSLSCRLIEND